MQIQKINKSLSLIFFMASLMAWMYFSGKDVSWDFLNYHLYGPHLLLENRWDLDYFAGSIQGYINPIVYIPAYLLIKTGAPDWALAFLLAIPALVLVFFVWRLAEQLTPGNSILNFLQSALVLSTALWLIVVGTTFTDGLTAVMLFIAVYYLLRDEGSVLKNVLYSGLLLGAAVGIKLTNGFFPPVFFVCYAYLKRHDGNVVRKLAYFSLSIILGFLVLQAPWSWRLWVEFGNPFFPFFNDIFKSPYFLPEGLHDKRFMGAGAIGAFELFWLMPRIESWVYAETGAPEIKPIVLVFLLMVFPFFYKVGIRGKKYPNADTLVFWTLLVFMSYFLWAFSSRIGRYGIFIWMAMGLIVPAWCLRIFGLKKAVVISIGVLIAQCALNYTASVKHWGAAKWGGEWFEPEIPEELKEKPYTFLTTGLQTNSALAIFLHKKSRWISIQGQNTLPTGERMPYRLRGALADGDLMAVVPSLFKPSGDYSGVSDEESNYIDSVFLPYGYRRSASPCMPIRMRAQIVSPWNDVKTNSSRLLHVCPLESAPQYRVDAVLARMKKIDYMFDAIEDKCPNFYSPKRIGTTLIGVDASRFYFNTTVYLYTDGPNILARAPQQMDRFSVATFDVEKLELTSEIFCHEYPKRLFLE